jgi:hypothetical protein
MAAVRKVGINNSAAEKIHAWSQLNAAEMRTLFRRLQILTCGIDVDEASAV